MFAFAPALPSRTDLDWCWYLRRQGREGEMLERVLHDIGVMHPGGWADWSASSMTETGAPVSVVFREGQIGLEMITEVADPASDPTNRVNEVCKIMQSLGSELPSAAFRDVLSAAQGDTQLRYGARLGLCHDGTKCDTMLYAELPAAANDLVSLLLPAPIQPVLDKLGTRVATTSLAYNARTKDVTIYWVADGVDRQVLPVLAAPANACHDALSRAIDSMTDLAPSTGLPTRKLGFSYAAHDMGTAPQLKLFFSAKHMFGTDAAIEERVRAYGGDAIKAYTNLMEIGADTPKNCVRHGLVGMHADGTNAPNMCIDVAAPWHCPFEVS